MTGPNPQEGGKHTPGEWVVGHPGHGVRVESKDGHGVVNDGWVISEFFGPDAEGNARLSAAAPALLEALSFLVNEVDGMRAFEDGVRQVIGHTNWSVLAVRLKEARAAILQATGGDNGR